MQKTDFMREAVQLSFESVKLGTGPFGAVVVKDGKIIGRGHNRVASDNDPTAHAEMTAIREACQNLNDFNLEGCELYSSCEPCPMCMAATYWSRIETVYYANSTADAADAGFDDEYIYRELASLPKDRKIHMEQITGTNALRAFEEWEALEDKIEY